MSRSEVAITVEELSKRYKLGLMHAGSIRELVNGVTDRLLGRRQEQRVDATEFWALRDINFSVQEGEVVGLIGRNGAGKSTLLKILSRITKPTTGRARIHGRVGSLLEVGTGFHPELTGRENIYLNGTMLGMSTREISRKLDQIIDFSEIEKFIDTPVKRYSSGMYVRLAFAVAAHLEPEVLIVDEVLAVGDSVFQKKCIGKMQEVGTEGRTVLFVSHNMGAVKQLCSRAILLEHGQVVTEGRVNDVVNRYLLGATECDSQGWIPHDQVRTGTGEARIRRVQLLGEQGDVATETLLGQRLHVRLDVEVLEDIPDAHFEIGVYSEDGIAVAVTHRDIDCDVDKLPVGNLVVDAEVDVPLLPGRYRIGAAVYRDSGYTIDGLERTVGFEVARYGKDHARPYRWGEVRGYVRPETKWAVSGAAVSQRTLVNKQVK
ncbi:ABC transporter ATP-binding protein [Roseimaritima ulvae]|uniref:Teichoic acids export ATP-binding protein TagH n=1 Tax=Roseimaritima ulvae TaxID=980254 RepID=A0A5B9QNQ5_9BACT|nr:ABC transporter ATP-binding protein [Roseimaritima ulvae]QEG38646.1 Teichoic acids export ATP-binding protein TagH [Roseimaritima ulvae]